MAIVTNVITIPTPAAATARAVGGAATAPAVPTQSGRLYNGHTRVFAKVAPGDSGTVNIKFSLEINSIDGNTFNDWRKHITKILGSATEEEIAGYSGIAQTADDGEGYASQYSLATFSYVTTGECDSYDDQSAVPFGPRPDREYRQVMGSIFKLDSSMIELKGELTATTANPTVEAFITATYFVFGNNKVTSFAGYRGSIVLVDGDEEMVTYPGILAPV